MQTTFQQMVVDKFREAFRSAQANLMLDTGTIEDHPLLADTLSKIDGLTVVDDVSLALSARADELQAMAEANRGSPDWPVICVAMGAARSSAFAAWNHS